MNLSKKINVNFSSLVGLKAELLRKQAEVKEAKNIGIPVQTTAKLKTKHKRKVQDPNEKEEGKEKLLNAKDVKEHKKSKLMLEAKSRLYEKLKKNKRNNENFLVDFKNKSSDESEDEHLKMSDNEDSDVDPENDWVDYQDCFGRTRKCLRRDLSLMQQKDDLVRNQIIKPEKANNEYIEKNESTTMYEKEPDIEIRRKKWEEQTTKLADKANIHYQDILFDEARAHGVGYYAFAQDEEIRAKQQENLLKLRKETEQKQKKAQELRELKEKMEQNRLKTAIIRKRIRAGLPAEPTEEEIAELNQTKSETITDNAPCQNSNAANSKNESEKEQPQDSLAEIEDKIKAFGELLGKKTTWRVMSQEEWVEKCRNERKKEFAPVYSNFKLAEVMNNKSYSSLNSSSDSDEPNTIGPLPPSYQFSSSNPVDPNSEPALSEQSPIKELNINEEKIVAGLKYLREKFEEKKT
ncbi:coiled-coil domain-containing protein 174 [Prorops nasuta]|uniref:coiled-coil domain-containing protein 174 n=1 Tax=Prorops nasuta TaxID=863751 RepID=UPI0034CDD102